MQTQTGASYLCHRGVRALAVASSVLFCALLSATPSGAAPAVIPAAATAPAGPEGAWTNVFDDEFDGTALDTSKWMPNWYVEGGVQNTSATYRSNVSVTDGNLVLTLASSNSGASVSSNGPGGVKVDVGQFVEARVAFPGNGTTIYNWPAWWISGPSWPAAGENDIAEGLGNLTVNYHSPSGSHNQGAIPGNWSNAFHTYGVYRGANHADVYWDRKLVKSYATDDNGKPQAMIFNVGNGNTKVYGPGSRVRVDWVRVWAPGPTVAAPSQAPPTVAVPSQTSRWSSIWGGVIASFQSLMKALLGG